METFENEGLEQETPKEEGTVPIDFWAWVARQNRKEQKDNMSWREEVRLLEESGEYEPPEVPLTHYQNG
ncbi:hypothetical protein A2713_01465 [candidate division WWE3 bacterium RIFCSPHIGHO2_01_FULL_35_17]|uniref:Uncharacterized protein n=1 Tax=candidate division WWE3 bacterium RIFCSPHIGHO2_01_FULL_35_17 TaxID=1802614 RepID=A0A1F4UNY9_UNCKA|nr:MAG: hypothetical protein A2713_01465 [candidate division WWE3 bacterium RIFCSPHIGHO2_01_FULL_35_17]